MKLTAADFASGLDHCLALWITAAATGAALAPQRAAQISRVAGYVNVLRIAPGWRWNCSAAPTIAHAWPPVLDLAARCALPAVAAGDVHMHRRSRRRLQDLLTAIRHGCTLAAAGARLFANGERHLRAARACWRSCIRRSCWLRAWRSPSAASFDLGRVAVPIPGRAGAGHVERQRAPARAGAGAGAQRRWPAGVPTGGDAPCSTRSCC